MFLQKKICEKTKIIVKKKRPLLKPIKLILLKFFDPIIFYKIFGDQIILNEIFKENVSHCMFLSLNHTNKVLNVCVTNNLSLEIFFGSHSLSNCPNIDLLLCRLNSISSKSAHKLASTLLIYSKQYEIFEKTFILSNDKNIPIEKCSFKNDLEFNNLNENSFLSFDAIYDKEEKRFKTKSMVISNQLLQILHYNINDISLDALKAVPNLFVFENNFKALNLIYKTNLIDNQLKNISAFLLTMDKRKIPCKIMTKHTEKIIDSQFQKKFYLYFIIENKEIQKLKDERAIGMPGDCLIKNDHYWDDVNLICLEHKRKIISLKKCGFKIKDK